MKEHPGEMERVTVDTVRAALDNAAVRYTRVWLFRRGVVHVDVQGWTAAARRRASMAVNQALEPKTFSEFWTAELMSELTRTGQRPVTPE